MGYTEKGVIGGGRTFYKMSGSGNDFVFFDVDSEPAGDLETPAAIQEISSRGTGVVPTGVGFFSGQRTA